MQQHEQHLHFIKDISYAIMGKYNKNELTRVPYAYLELLSRTWAAAAGLLRLVPDMEKEPELELSAALVLRTMILDFFIGLRGFDIRRREEVAGKTEQEVKGAIEAYVNTVLGDGLKVTSNHFARMEKQGHITEGKLHEVLGNLTVRYSQFLSPYNNDKKVNPIFANPPNNGQLFDLISENPELKPLAQHFDTYALYSKYEHFSIMSYDAFRRDLKAQAETLSQKIDILLLHLFKNASMLLYYLKDDFIKDKFFEIGTYIGKEEFKLGEKEIAEMLKNS